MLPQLISVIPHRRLYERTLFTMFFLGENDLTICHDFDGLRKCMADALQSVSLKKATNFSRSVYNLDPKNSTFLGVMPAVDHSKPLLGYKVITIFKQNKQHNINPHQGIVVLLDEVTGQVKCILDGCFVTALRTAAVSAVATEILSRPQSSTLAVIGAGRQAIEHIKAITKIRPIENIHIYSKTKASYASLKTHFRHDPFNILFKETAKAAVLNADILVTCTPAKEYILSIDELPKGIHVNAIGACRPGDREVNLHNHPLLKVYLDSKEACFTESDEIIQPCKEKILSYDKIIGEIGECIANLIPKRCHEDEITFFKSVGLSIEDVCAANFFYNKALELKVGQHLIP